MRNFAGTCKGISGYNLVYNFFIQLLRLQSSAFVVQFQTHFGMETIHFQKAVLRMKLFFSFAIQLIQGCENMSSLVLLGKPKCFTRVALWSFVQHSCRTLVVRVALLLHSCCQCLTRVALVLFVLHSCRSCLAPVL